MKYLQEVQILPCVVEGSSGREPCLSLATAQSRRMNSGASRIFAAVPFYIPLLSSPGLTFNTKKLQSKPSIDTII